MELTPSGSICRDVSIEMNWAFFMSVCQPVRKGVPTSSISLQDAVKGAGCVRNHRISSSLMFLLHSRRCPVSADRHGTQTGTRQYIHRNCRQGNRASGNRPVLGNALGFGRRHRSLYPAISPDARRLTARLPYQADRVFPSWKPVRHRCTPTELKASTTILRLGLYAGALVATTSTAGQTVQFLITFSDCRLGAGQTSPKPRPGR